jgi:hypothetical protein
MVGLAGVARKEALGLVQQMHARITIAQVKTAVAQDRVQQQKPWTSGFLSDNLLL